MMAPRFSIVTPVHDPPLALLGACLASITGQTFGDWELCLVDDGSKSAAVRAELRRLAAADPRVKLVERPVAGGIVAASNEGLAMATGEFVVLVDHDDRLDPRALELVDAALSSDDEIDYVYTDEDKLAADGTLRDTFYKPDWSPERLRSQNYCTHLSVLRRRIVEEVGGFREGFDGSQDHDLILRVTERARRVHHVPEVLYHWCITPGSAAGDSADAPAAKPHAQEAGRRAVAEQHGAPRDRGQRRAPRDTRPLPRPAGATGATTAGERDHLDERPGRGRSGGSSGRWCWAPCSLCSTSPSTRASRSSSWSIATRRRRSSTVFAALDVRLVEGEGPLQPPARGATRA